jgi:Ran GTPase-activating protein (RanGAP) involved in mRNA processing and transport
MEGIRWQKCQDNNADAERSEEGNGAVTIDLSGSNLTDCDLVEVVKEFSVAPETVLLRKNLLTDEAAKVLSRTSVMHLDVGMNFVGEEGGRALAISSCCRKAKLRTLRLDSNSVEEAAVAFADALARTECTIEHLDLADNNVDDNGVVAIATALAGNTKLRVLDLSCNNLHSCGIVAISDALRDNKTLIILGLCETFLGNRGAEALASALQSNKSLASINLKDSGVTADGIAHLAEALKSNRTVSTLHLTDNGRDEKAEGHLRTCLEGNKTLCHIPGIYGLDDLLTRNMERQVSLAAFAREGDLESMRNLIEGGVGREVLLSSGLSI